MSPLVSRDGNTFSPGPAVTRAAAPPLKQPQALEAGSHGHLKGSLSLKKGGFLVGKERPGEALQGGGESQETAIPDTQHPNTWSWDTRSRVIWVWPALESQHRCTCWVKSHACWV